MPAVGVAAAALLALGACGGSNKHSSSAPSTPTSTPSAGTVATPPTSTTPAVDPRLARKPTVRPPQGPAPKQLKIRDLIVGTGPTAQPGRSVTVQYVGVLFHGGKQFDASWDHNMPFSFPLGAGQVIPGWDRGVPGMRVGGRRQLIIPASLAYGPQGSPPAIGPNAPLIFVIDLLNVQ